MQITVSELQINDGRETPNMRATVTFYEDDAHYHRCAEVTVFIEKTVTDLAEIKRIALQSAYEYLATVQSSHSSQGHP